MVERRVAGRDDHLGAVGNDHPQVTGVWPGSGTTRSAPLSVNAAEWWNGPTGSLDQTWRRDMAPAQVTSHCADRVSGAFTDEHLGTEKRSDVAHVVGVQMGEHHRVDRGRVDTDPAEQRGRVLASGHGDAETAA